MARTRVEFRMPVTLTFDDADMTGLTAVADFYRMLAEAEQAGFMDRRLIGISYGEATDQKALAPVTGGQQPGGPIGELTALAENLGVMPDDLDELVHDAAIQRASEINNGGLGPQVKYLAESYGARWTRSLIGNCGPNPLESIADLQGSMIDGYDDGKVNSVLGRISDASGIRLVCVWDAYDSCGVGGNSQFYVEEASGLRELTGDLWRWLNDDPDDPDAPAFPGTPASWVGENAGFMTADLPYADGFHNYARRDLP